MGLRDELQTDLKEAFDDDLSDAVHGITLKQFQKTQSVYDPTTGENTKVSKTFSSRGIFTNYTESERFNTTIEPTDSRVIILANEIETTPQIQDKITENISGIEYNIIGMLKDPVGATHELQVRKV